MIARGLSIHLVFFWKLIVRYFHQTLSRTCQLLEEVHKLLRLKVLKSNKFTTNNSVTARCSCVSHSQYFVMILNSNAISARIPSPQGLVACQLPFLYHSIELARKNPIAARYCCPLLCYGIDFTNSRGRIPLPQSLVVFLFLPNG